MKTAQQAYQETLDNLKDVDIQPALKMAEEAIDKAIKEKAFVTLIGAFTAPIAEKAAVELEKFGYWVSVQFANKYLQDNSPMFNLHINFKYLPAPSRESYEYAT